MVDREVSLPFSYKERASVQLHGVESAVSLRPSAPSGVASTVAVPLPKDMPLWGKSCLVDELGGELKLWPSWPNMEQLWWATLTLEFPQEAGQA